MTSVRTSGISDREAEVLAAIGAHLSNAQISNRMHISVRTVESHVSSLLRKLGAPDRHALAELAAGQPAGLIGAPTPWTTFIGRSEERAAALRAVADARLVTMVGPGGVGKTRLATVVAESAVSAGTVRGGVFVDLVPAREGFVTQAAAAALGVSERPGESLEAAVHAQLGPARWLVVLDNCEHLLDPVAEFVGRLLAACPGAVVLATSRERLGLPGEQVLAVSPLSVVAAPAGRSDAASLFLARAPGVGDAGAVEVVCARLDGMPLAIELAAARSASLGTDGLLAGLEDHLRLLAGGRAADERHRSLRTVLDWSHDLLEDDERALFRRLGVFVGGFGLDAAVAVGGLGDRGHTVDVIGRLADKSLLRHPPGAGSSRWRMLGTIRAYALDRLTAAGEEATVRQRYLGGATATAEDLESRLGAGDGWRAEFGLAADDLRHALATAPEGEPPYRLAAALGHLTYARRFFTEARQHYQRAADLAPGPAQAATQLRHASDIARAEGRAGLSFDLLLATAEQAEAAGDRGRAQECLATAVDVANRFPAAFPAEIPYERLRQLLDTALAMGPPANAESAAMLALARAWNGPEKCAPDLDLSLAALQAARDADDPLLISDALDALGSAQSNAGHALEAHRCGQERIDLLRRMPRHQPSSAMEIIDVLHMATDNAVSAGELSYALAVAQRMQDEDIVAGYAQMMISKPLVPLVLQGQFEAARELGGRVWQAWERAGRQAARWMSPAVYSLALVEGLRGSAAGYTRWRNRTYELIQDEDPATCRNLTLFAVFADARIALQEGKIDEGVVELLRGDSWYETLHWYFDAYAWSLAAEIAVVAGRPDAEALLEVAAPVATENAWAAAGLARARGRLLGDPALLRDSVAGWERIGARFERDYTLELLRDS